MARSALLGILCGLLLGVGVQGQESGSLSVVEAALHQYDGGPPVPAGFEFLPGDTVFVTFRVAGFADHEVDDEDRLRLTYTISATDPAGLLLKEKVEGGITTALSRQDKEDHWMPLVRYDVLIPPLAPSGQYHVAIAVADEIADTKAELDLPLVVVGHDIEPSDSITIRNFHFYRTETSTQPLPRGAYRPGDSVWARFDITGYQFGPNNRFHVDYGIKVLRASGSVLFEQPVAAEEDRESFYPQRSIQGGLSLNLTPDLTPGEYTVIVTVHDQVADTSHVIKETFEVQ